MSRRTTKPAAAAPEKPVATRPTPITDLPHLEAAARRLHGTGRVIRVEIATQSVRTPGRTPGQWLASGEPLKPAPPQYISWSDIDRDRDDRWEGFDR